MRDLIEIGFSVVVTLLAYNRGRRDGYVEGHADAVCRDVDSDPEHYDAARARVAELLRKQRDERG